MATRNNTVPRGQAGTGAAFLLGGSRALQNWISQDQRNAQVRSANAQAQLMYDQGVAKSYAQNRIKTPIGQAYQQEILSDVEKLNEVGAKYLAQGFDVFNPNYRDPKQVEAYNTYMQDRAIVESKIAARKAYEETANAERKEFNKNPYGFESNPDDVYSEFEKNNTLYDIVTKGVQYPSLDRVFDRQKNIVSVIPEMKITDQRLEGNNMITEVKPNMAQIVPFSQNIISSGQNRQWAEKQIGGSLDGILKTTDEKEIRKALDNEFRSPNGVEVIAELKTKGKVPSFDSPQYAKFLDDAVKEQLKAEKTYDKIVSDIAQDAIAKVDPSYKKVPDFSLENQAMKRRRLQLAEEANDRARENDAGSVQSTPISKTFYTSADEKGNRREVFKVDNFVSVNPTPVGTTQLGRVYDVNQGKQITLPATASLEITGIGNIPNKNSKTGAKGTELVVFATDKDGGEYAIPENEVPVKTKNDKNYQKAKQQATSVRSSQTKAASTQKNKPTKDPLGLF